jgi:hypothetical protein
MYFEPVGGTGIGTFGLGTVIKTVHYDNLDNGTLSWEGSAGQLFSITNNLTSGSIFSVNDVSGIPIIDVNANSNVNIVAYGGSLGIGTTAAIAKLDVRGDVNITGSITAPDINELYELDDISTATDGLQNTFTPTFNYDRVTVTDPFKLLITVNGILQSAYVHNKEYVFKTDCLASRTGYTIDHDSNLKFTESIPTSSDIVIKTVSGKTRTTVKQYPFAPLDLML